MGILPYEIKHEDQLWSFLHSIPKECSNRECVSTGAVGEQTCRSLGHHLLHPMILRPRALFYRTDCTHISKFLTHTLNNLFLKLSFTLFFRSASPEKILKKILNYMHLLIYFSTLQYL